MKSPRWVALAALVVIAAAVGAYFLLRPTDESRIRAQLTRLAAAVRVTDEDAQAHPIGRMAHVNAELAKVFEADVRASIPEALPHDADREELVELVVGAPRFLRAFDVDFTNVTIKLDDTRTTALVGATADVKLGERDGSPSRERRAVDFRFVRKDGEWLVRTLTVWSKGEAEAE